jgi:hypothetical protein
MSIDRKIGLELGRGPEVGRDPRLMTAEELVALGHTPMSPLKALRLRCIDCYGGCLKSVRCCTATDCPSWPFRLGHSPWRKELSQERKEQLRRLGAETAATRITDQKYGAQIGTDAGAATTLPDAIDGENCLVNLVGEEEGA